MATTSFGKYAVTAQIGRGGMADVYRARHPTLDRDVAIKVIQPQFVTTGEFEERFRREAKLVASLRHPNIVQVYDYDVVDGQPYMVMEFLDGASLAERLAQYRARGERPPLDETPHILEAIAAALDYAHDRGAIHRDVKPANILFTSTGEPVLTDFGIAKMVGGAVQLSARGMPIGTPAYMSPEQAQAEPVDARTDIYSLGVVLYEMIAGRVPFLGESPTAVMMQHLTAEPPPPRQFNADLPEAIQAVVLRALAKKPEARFATAGDLARALRTALSGQAPAAAEHAGANAAATPAPETTPVTTPAAKRLPWLTQLGAAAEIFAPMVGRQAPDVHRAPEDRRSLIATILGIVGILFASLQVLVQFFDLVTRPIGPLMNALPYVIAALFAGGAALALYVVVRSPLRATRQRASVALALTLVAGVAWGGWSIFNRYSPPGRFIVAIADFDGSQASRRVDFARRIYDQINAEMQDVGAQVEVQRTSETYKDAESARTRGTERKATLVIWGWYDDAGVSPHVELLQVPTLLRESFGVPLVLDTASAAAPGSLALPRSPTQRDLARFVRVPATMRDFELFAKNGPQQITTVSTAMLGLAFFVNGDSTRALQLFDKALASAPANGDIAGLEDVYFQRATVLFERNRPAEAMADLQKAIALKPDLYEAYYNLAIAESETCAPARQLERAIADAATAARLKPKEPAAHMLLGDLYRQAGKYDQAIAEFQAALQLTSDAHAYELLASAQWAAGDASASKSWQTALALRQKQPADSAAAQISLGDVYLNNGDYDRALASFQAAQKLAPDDASAQRGLGNAYSAKKDWDAAERAYKQWIALAPQDADAHLFLGLMYAELNRNGSALAELKQAASLSTCSAGAHLVLGNIYHSQNDFSQAAAEYQAVTTIDPANVNAWYLLGVTRYLQGQSADAVQALQAAIKLKADFAEAHFALGQIYADQKQFDRAALEWEQAAKIGPGNATYFVALADAYEQTGRLDDAAAAYQKALRFEDSAPIHAFLGLVLVKQNQFDAALAEYQKAVALDAKSTLALSGLAETYTQLGRWDEAAAAFEQALALTDVADLHRELAMVSTQQGKTDAAILEYQKAAAGNAQDWYSRYWLGNLYSRQAKFDDALKSYRQALALQPNRPEVHQGVSSLEYKRCNLTGATQEANAAVTAAPNQSLYRGTLAAMLDAQGRSAEAGAIYAGFRQAGAEDALAHIFAGEYLWRSGKLDDAVREFQLVLQSPKLIPIVASLAHDDLGQVYAEQDKLIAAESELRLALEATPANADAALRRGDLRLRQNDAAGALAAYDQAATLLPAYAIQFSADTAALLSISLPAERGLALARQGKTAESAAALDQALALAHSQVELTPQWPTARVQLAYVLLARGEADKADAEFAAAVQCDASLSSAKARFQNNLARLH